MKTDDYALIVAHPDDEVLWASSILENAKKIIICFSSVNGNNTLSKSRQKLQQHYPLLSTKFLSINQPYNYTNKASTVELNNDLSTLSSEGGIIYTGNPEILKKVCPGVYGTIKPVGYCMIGIK